MNTGSSTPMLEIRGMSKSFGPVQVLRGIDLSVAPGEVRALLGSNGAGKSTLIRILSGAETRDAGRIVLNNREHDPALMHDQEDGIAVVYQELSLVPGLSIAENIMLGQWPRHSAAGLRAIDRQRMLAEAQSALSMLGVDIDPLREVYDLSLGEQQLVEIAKALRKRPRVLILDEPTSALTAHDADRLITLVRQLAATGMTVLYVSHRMDEIPQVADSIAIMRDGAIVGTHAVGELTTRQIAERMIGHAPRKNSGVRREVAPDAPVVLSAEHLRTAILQGVNLELREGEVLGIAGLMGSGRSELLRALFGRDRIDSGRIRVRGRAVQARWNERAAIAAGFALSPEERKAQGLVLTRSIRENLTLASLRHVAPGGVIRASEERTIAQRAVGQLAIKLASVEQDVGDLSGGNQQKVVLGRWLAASAQIYLLDEPTRGVDINAKEQVYALVRHLSDAGKSVVFVSSENAELFEVCHRIAVMRGGAIVRTLAHDETDEHELLALSMKDSI
ncbi:sugar ABC transporter ATP-binding protein [Microbacterium sp. CIAB417]|uniref:sugar ABC transporter ATP-binding protein n=1 Tax=Microbacterium sp. CIAB417 TaxID=2860287 RepID=UPI001FAC8AD0|nr:sugar ABC transporter ATP-binding protein [Microbacterium sp. CIAB417]